MIYKFYQPETDSIMEIESFNRKNQSIELPETVNFSIFIKEDEDNFKSIDLNKEDVFKLIGVLHLLHKEMK